MQSSRSRSRKCRKRARERVRAKRLTLQLNLHLNSTFGAMFYLFWSVFLFGLLGRLLSVSSDNFRFCSGTLLGSKDDSLTEWGGEGQSSLVTQGFKRDLDHVVRDFFFRLLHMCLLRGSLCAIFPYFVTCRSHNPRGRLWLLVTSPGHFTSPAGIFFGNGLAPHQKNNGPCMAQMIARVQVITFACTFI